MELKLNIQLDNSIFHHDDGTLDFSQVAKILSDITAEVDLGSPDFFIKDDNGSWVGQLQITPPEDKP